MLFTYGPYYWDDNNKLLLCKEIVIARGADAVRLAMEIVSPRDWVRVGGRTPMYNRAFNGLEEPVCGMGHSSNRCFDREGKNLREHTLESDRELCDTDMG